MLNNREDVDIRYIHTLNVIPMRVGEENMLVLKWAHLDELLAKIVSARAHVKHDAGPVIGLNLTARRVASLPHNIRMGPSDRTTASPDVDLHRDCNCWVCRRG